MNYPMYGNNQYYMQDLQNMRDRIDQQMRQIQQPMQMQQTPAINQTFQLAPNQQSNANDIEGKIVKDIEEVKNTLVLKTGVFVNSDYSTLWIKDTGGNIRTFNTSEIVELSESEKEVIELKKQKEQDNQTILYLKQELENIKKSLDNTDIKNKTKGVDKV
jgi:multidrug resistance efflux pump